MIKPLAKFLPLSLLILAAAAGADPTSAWTTQSSTVDTRLRGISAVDEHNVWASGANNTVIHTVDGGAHWSRLDLPADMRSTKLDFRDVHAIDAQTVYLLSIGEASASRIYKTTDAGLHWQLQYTNPDPKGFLDAMGFWDKEHGLVIGDSIDGHFQILSTDDGGTSWTKIPDAVLPPALPNEGAFSASASNIAIVGQNDAWIAMNARVLHTGDRGRSWTVSAAPLASSESAGIFSIAFRDRLHGVIVGGDYKKENAAVDNAAYTVDGGKTWTLVRGTGLSGYRSAVKYVPGASQTLIAVGPSGADMSRDDGITWTPLSLRGGFDAISFAPGRATAWLSGDQGSLARWH